MLYSTRDVGPAGISRLVAMLHLFRHFPRRFQDGTVYRAIRPAGAGWLRSRIAGVPITMGRKVVSTAVAGSQLRLRLDDGTERLVDHALLATGFRVDVSRYPFLSLTLLKQLETVDGFPVLKRGLESSLPGLRFLGKPAAWSFGPLLGFISGAEFASNELIRSITRGNVQPLLARRRIVFQGEANPANGRAAEANTKKHMRRRMRRGPSADGTATPSLFGLYLLGLRYWS
jgi:FAD-dependent urate hydroxylase